MPKFPGHPQACAGQASREDVGIPNAGFQRRVTLFRIAEDALRGSCRPRRRAALVNVRKHARAHRVQVRLADVNHGWHVQIDDDGDGFEPSTGGSVPGHMGLTAMRSVRKSPAAGGRWSPVRAPERAFPSGFPALSRLQSSCWGGFNLGRRSE
jgi:hypothetical protein